MHNLKFRIYYAGMILLICFISTCSKNYQIPRHNTIPVDSLKTYSVAEVDPKPKPVGGYEHLLSKMKYPKEARNRGIKGKVVVNLLVTKEGDGIGHYIEFSPHPILSKEALKVVKETKFTPGKIDSQSVNTWYSIPFYFEMGKKSELQHTF